MMQWSFRDYLAHNVSGVGGSLMRVKASTIRDYPLRVAPLVEQRAIVAKIEALFSELDKGVEQLQAVREQLKRYRQAVLKAAFEGKLTAEWRAQQQAAGTLPSAEDLLDQIQAERAARYEQQLADWKQAVKDWEAAGGKSSGRKKPRRPAKPKDLPPLSAKELADLPDLPEGWAWHRLGLATLGVEYGSAKKSHPEGDVPVIRMGNMQNGKIVWDDLVYTSDPEEIGQYRLAQGDVLFNRTNSPELVGKTVIYRGETPATFAGYLIRVNQISSISLAQFLTYFLNSHQAKQHGNRVKTDGVNQSNINGTKLAAYPFPFCSLVEQTEAVSEIDSRFSVLDELEKAVETGLKQAEALRQSILKKAFEGRLLSEAELAAVQADPAYEPAEKLLERIRAEREQSGTGTKRGRKGGKGKTARLPKVSGPERYKQAAYAAYAVQRLAGRETFGRVQQMKLVYLIPHALAQESKVYARREAAGPLDPAIHKIEGLAKKNGWFTTRKIGQRYKYTPGAKIDEAVEFAKDKFGDKADRVDWLLGQFAKMDTERAELVATAFAVWNDHLIDGHDPSEDEIVAGVHGWHPEKVTKFPPDRIAKCIQWMKDNSFVPTGIGPKTTEGMAAE
jgi:type I restriction enzyme S subunit